MKIYGNGRISKPEMTQAWLVKHAEWKTGKTFAPDSLLAFQPTASLVLIAQSPAALKGVTVSTDAERAVRASIDALGGNGLSDATEAQKAVAQMVSQVNGAVAGSSGGGGSGGGSSGGSGSGGASGSGTGGGGDGGSSGI